MGQGAWCPGCDPDNCCGCPPSVKRRPLRAILHPDPFGHTFRGHVYFGALDARRSLARAWREFAVRVDGWISP